jgi:hypothetical protein
MFSWGCTVFDADWPEGVTFHGVLGAGVSSAYAPLLHTLNAPVRTATQVFLIPSPPCLP